MLVFKNISEFGIFTDKLPGLIDKAIYEHEISKSRENIIKIDFLKCPDQNILIVCRWNSYRNKYQVLADGVLEDEFITAAQAIEFFNGFFSSIN